MLCLESSKKSQLILPLLGFSSVKSTSFETSLLTNILTDILIGQWI